MDLRAAVAAVTAVAVTLVVPSAASRADGAPPGSAAGWVQTAPDGRAAAVAPVPGPVVRAFRPPAHRYGPGHRGVDLEAAAGVPVAAALAGTVAFAGPVAGVGWVTVAHSGGLATTYGPLEPRLVQRGDRVAAGAVLGLLAPGARHLDWGARLGEHYLDPLTLLARWRVHLTTARPQQPPPPAALLADLRGEAAAASRRAGPATLAWPARGRVTSPFGLRVHPLDGVPRLHAGIDIAAPAGTPVGAAAAGVVTAAGWRGGYGLTVDVAHASGETTRYAHLSRVGVAAGAAVAAGKQLGAVGSTGASTGPHLHFEVLVNGRPVDPLRRLP